MENLTTLQIESESVNTLTKLKKPKRETRKVVSSVQKAIPIRDIKDGIIITKDKQYVKILEVRPITFFLKSSAEKNAIIAVFRSMFRIVPNNIQFMSVSLPANLNAQIQYLEEDIRNETNSACVEIDRNYKEVLLNAQRIGITRRFFIVIVYQKPSNMFFGKTPSFATIKESLTKDALTIASVLKQCGNDVIGALPSKEEDDSNYLTNELLYTLLNRSNCRKIPYAERYNNIHEKYSKALDEERVYIPPTEYLSPTQISFTSKNFVVVDGMYYSFLYIPSNGYEDGSVAGWLTKFANYGLGVDVNVYFEKLDGQSQKTKISRNLIYARVNAGQSAETSEGYEVSVKNMTGAEYLLNGLRADDVLFNMYTMITVSGSSPEIVNKITDDLKRMAEQSSIKLKACTYQEEDAFFSALPLGRFSPTLAKKAHQNVLTEGAASTYLFTTSEMNDEKGIYLGVSLQNGSLVIVDLFNRQRFLNSNIFICGQSGSGKTFTLSLIALRLRVKHIPIFILTPEKSDEYIRVCDAVGGQYITIGPGYKDNINIMEITKVDMTIKEDTNLYDSSYLATKVENLKQMINLLLKKEGQLSAIESGVLESALYEVYKKFGITTDNNSLFDPNDEYYKIGDLEHAKYKRMPIIEDLYNELQTRKNTERICAILSQFVTGSYSNFNQQTNVELDNPFTIINLEPMKEGQKSFGMFLAMDYCWSKVRENRLKKKALMIDEWWSVAQDEVSATYSFQIAKTIRAYSGAFIIATQQMGDVMTENEKLGKGVLNNCAIKVMMKMEENDSYVVQEMMNLNENERQRLVGFQRGNAIFMAGKNKMDMFFKANEVEHSLITTDSDDLKRLQVKKEEKEEMLKAIERGQMLADKMSEEKQKEEQEKVLSSFTLSIEEENGSKTSEQNLVVDSITPLDVASIEDEPTQETIKNDNKDNGLIPQLELFDSEKIVDTIEILEQDPDLKEPVLDKKGLSESFNNGVQNVESKKEEIKNRKYKKSINPMLKH